MREVSSEEGFILFGLCDKQAELLILVSLLVTTVIPAPHPSLYFVLLDSYVVAVMAVCQRDHSGTPTDEVRGLR